MKIYLNPERDALQDVFQVDEEKAVQFDEFLIQAFSNVSFSVDGGQEEIRPIQDEFLLALAEESKNCSSLQELALLFFQAGISMCSMQYMIQAARTGVQEIQSAKESFGRTNLN